ncbi:MAG: hypothetical protein K0R52_284 [Alphaproteobacteria bacterium]|jgi:hypothetical protein|nr:hypothetical protein [Alphaproteobacteria bacterium]
MEPESVIEFSRVVLFDQIGVTGATYHIEAKEEERRLLAVRFGLVAIHQLTAHFTLSHATEEPGCYHIKGDVTGDVVQSCVSTLKDVPAHVQAAFHILLRPSRGGNTEEEFIIDLDDERDIEYYADEFIDLGETAAQYLYLNLNPFPHAPDAPEFSEDPTKEVLSPLAQGLKGLKKGE